MKLTPSLRRILNALDQHGDMEACEIATTAHVGENTLSGGGYMTKLLVMGLVRVSRWERADKSGPFRPVYSVTHGESVPKPAALKPSERCRRWRKKVGYRSAQWHSRQQARHSMNELLRITA